jgi:hypothetical protein
VFFDKEKVMIYKEKIDLTLWCMLSQPPSLIVLTDHYVHIQRNGIYTEISIQLDQDCQLATSIEINGDKGLRFFIESITCLGTLYTFHCLPIVIDNLDLAVGPKARSREPRSETSKPVPGKAS